MAQNLKKSQITIFIILGVVILITIGVLFYVRGKLVKKEVLAETQVVGELPELAREVEVFINNCLDDVAKNGVDLLGKQSGYIYQHNWCDDTTKCPLITSNPFITERTIQNKNNAIHGITNLADNYKLSYLLYYDKNSHSPALSYLPPIDSTQPINVPSMLNAYVTDRFKEICIKGIPQRFEPIGLEVKGNDPKLSVTVNGEDISFKVDYTVQVKDKKTGAQTTLNKFNIVTYRLRLAKIHKLLNEYLSKIDLKKPSEIKSLKQYYLDTYGASDGFIIEEYPEDYGIMINITDTQSKIRDGYFGFWFAMEPPELMGVVSNLNENIKNSKLLNTNLPNKLPDYIDFFCFVDKDENLISQYFQKQDKYKPIIEGFKNDLNYKKFNLLFVTKPKDKDSILSASCSGNSCMPRLAFSSKLMDDTYSIYPFPLICYADKYAISGNANVQTQNINFDKITYNQPIQNQLIPNQLNRKKDYFYDGLVVTINNGDEIKLTSLEINNLDTYSVIINVDAKDNDVKIFSATNFPDMSIKIPTTSCDKQAKVHLARIQTKTSKSDDCTGNTISDKKIQGLSGCTSITFIIKKADGGEIINSNIQCSDSQFDISNVDITYDDTVDSIQSCTYRHDVKTIDNNGADKFSTNLKTDCTEKGIAEFEIT